MNKVNELADGIPLSRYENLAPSHEQLGVFLNRHGEDGVTVINRLDDGDAHRFLAASPDDDLVQAIVRATNDHNLDPSAMMRIADHGHDVHRVKAILNNNPNGRWSSGTDGDSAANFNRHYNDHANDLDPTWTREDYRTHATRLANEQDGVEIYFQLDNQNLAIYDRSANEFVVRNTQGEIQTYFEPSPGYVDDRVDAGTSIRID